MGYFIKKLKQDQSGKCSYCLENKVDTPAVWMSSRLTFKRFACIEHVENLKKETQLQHKYDSHMSEADYQTWGRL